MHKTAKVTVQRVTIPGEPMHTYRIAKIAGPAELELNPVVNGQQRKILTAGDTVTHEELKRLCEEEIYDVTTLAHPVQ